jgi:hypothetical protein
MEEGEIARLPGSQDGRGPFSAMVAGSPRMFVLRTVAEVGFVPPDDDERCHLEALWDHLELVGYELCPREAMQALSEQLPKYDGGILPKRPSVILACRMSGHRVTMAGRHGYYSVTLPAESPGLQPCAEIIYMLPA